MRRTRVIIGLLLLLIAGGGIAWHFHLQERALMESDDYLSRQLAAPLVCGHWESKPSQSRPSISRIQRGWLSFLGHHRVVTGSEKSYFFSHRFNKQSVLMTVYSEEGKIISLGFTGPPGDRVAFQNDFFGKYPQFRKYHLETSPLTSSHAP